MTSTTFYPVCEDCGHAHAERGDHYGLDEGCCARCPKCESPETPVTLNKHVGMDFKTTGSHWENQWCRGITSRKRPCKNRAYVYVVEGLEPHQVEQFYCDSHLAQDPTRRKP